MKNIISLLLFTLICNNASADSEKSFLNLINVENSFTSGNSINWEKFLTQSDSFEYRLNNVEIENKYLNSGNIQVIIHNNSSQEIIYSGYSSNKPQLLTKEFKNGKWVPSTWEKCLHGVKYYKIKSKEKLTINYPKEYRNKKLYTILNTRGQKPKRALILLSAPNG
jgi:hypothetical protein